MAGAITDPVESHVHSLRPLLFDSVIGDSNGSVVASDERCWWLGVSEFFERDTNGTRCFAIVKCGVEFSFGGAGQYYFAHDLTKDEEGAVRRGWWISWLGWFGWVLGLVAEEMAGSRGCGSECALVSDKKEVSFSMCKAMSLAK